MFVLNCFTLEQRFKCNEYFQYLIKSIIAHITKSAKNRSLSYEETNYIKELQKELTNLVAINVAARGLSHKEWMSF